MCVLFRLTLHVRSSHLGPGGGRYQIRIPSRIATKRACANSCGIGTKRERNSCGALFFIMDAA